MPYLESIEERIGALLFSESKSPQQAAENVVLEFPNVPVPAIIYVLLSFRESLSHYPHPTPQKALELRQALLETSAVLGAELFALETLGHPSPRNSNLAKYWSSELMTG